MSRTNKHTGARFPAGVALSSEELLPAFLRFVAARAAKEGVDVSGLQVARATLEATWGDLCGFVFYGCDDATNERIATCFEKFAQKHSGSGSYGCQRSISLRGPRFFHHYTNGAKSWSTSGETSGRVALAEPIAKGYSVATVYYPCAD